MSWFSKKTTELPEAIQTVLSDISGCVDAAAKLPVASWKSWLMNWLNSKKQDAPPVEEKTVVSVSASEEKKNDLLVVMLSHSSFLKCTDYNLKVTISLPVSVKKGPAAAADASDAVADVPAVASPEDVNLVVAVSDVQPEVTNQEIYNSIEAEQPALPEQSKQSIPESETHVPVVAAE